MSLKKLGILYLAQEQKEEAKKAFETIKNDYPTSSEAQDIDKYIAVAE
jgi:TolA-binding protein